MNISEKMWLREFSEIFDILPYYLLVCLPIFIALSPINPVESASELDVHRLAQFELGGNLHGSKQVNLKKKNYVGVGGVGTGEFHLKLQLFFHN